VSDSLAPCPQCGRFAGRLADERSAPGTAKSVAGAGAVPDLDIPARPSKVTAVKAPAKPSAPAPPASTPDISQSSSRNRGGHEERANNAFGDPGARTFDAEDDDLSGGSLDLDLSKGPPLIADARPEAKASLPAVPAAGQAGGAAPPAGTPSSRSAEAGAPAAATATANAANGANGRGAPIVRVDVDPFEARALADYGDPPSAWWKMPQYAYRVLRRRPELKKLADQKKREADRAEGAAEDALLSFAQVVRSDAEKLGAYAGALQSVRATEDVLGQRDAVLASENDAHKHRQAEHDAKLAELEAQVSQIQMEERQIAGELAEADTLLKRAEAREKRVEIEVRNAISQAQTGATIISVDSQRGEGAKGPGQ
jgi:hypothetical protein